MSTATIANLIVVFGLLVAAGGIYRWLCRHDRDADSQHNRFIRETHQRASTAAVLDPITLAREPITPAGLPLPAEVTSHLEAFLNTNPDIAEGLDRLRQAVRDEQQKGEL